MLNAVERLARTYGLKRERCQQDKAVAEGQLRDYESRLGAVFRHADYERQLADLRDRLKAALAGKEQAEGEPTVAELDGQIKALRAANAVEAAPGRVGASRTPVRNGRSRRASPGRNRSPSWWRRRWRSRRRPRMRKTTRRAGTSSTTAPAEAPGTDPCRAGDAAPQAPAVEPVLKGNPALLPARASSVTV